MPCLAGAHASFVYKKNSPGLRLSARASRTATKQGIHLGQLMKNIAQRLGGEEVAMLVPQDGQGRVTRSSYNLCCWQHFPSELIE